MSLSKAVLGPSQYKSQGLNGVSQPLNTNRRRQRWMLQIWDTGKLRNQETKHRKKKSDLLALLGCWSWLQVNPQCLSAQQRTKNFWIKFIKSWSCFASFKIKSSELLKLLRHKFKKTKRSWWQSSNNELSLLSVRATLTIIKIWCKANRKSNWPGCNLTLVHNGRSTCSRPTLKTTCIPATQADRLFHPVMSLLSTSIKTKKLI